MGYSWRPNMDPAGTSGYGYTPRPFQRRPVRSVAQAPPAPQPNMDQGGAVPRPFVPQPGKGSGIGGSFRGPGDNTHDYVVNRLSPQEPYAAGQEAQRQDAYGRALADPSGTAEMFRSLYGDQANALAAPIQRQFTNTLDVNQANTAARFGGNASTEEQRSAYNTSDLFSRNLAEIIGGMSGQAVQAGANYTGQLGQAAQNASENRQRLTALILQGLGQSGPKLKKPGFLDTIGNIVGGAASAFAGAKGAQMGGQ